jgi:hypothetical protein
LQRFFKNEFVFTNPSEEDDIVSHHTFFSSPLPEKEPPKDLVGYRYNLPFHDRLAAFQAYKKHGKRKHIVVF